MGGKGLEWDDWGRTAVPVSEADRDKYARDIADGKYHSTFGGDSYMHGEYVAGRIEIKDCLVRRIAMVPATAERIAWERRRDAAPDLLEALKELVERRERACAQVGGHPDGSDGRYARARAAIAKAEGTSRAAEGVERG